MLLFWKVSYLVYQHMHIFYLYHYVAVAVAAGIVY